MPAPTSSGRITTRASCGRTSNTNTKKKKTKNFEGKKTLFREQNVAVNKLFKSSSFEVLVIENQPSENK